MGAVSSKCFLYKHFASDDCPICEIPDPTLQDFIQQADATPQLSSASPSLITAINPSRAGFNPPIASP